VPWSDRRCLRAGVPVGAAVRARSVGPVHPPRRGSQPDEPGRKRRGPAVFDRPPLTRVFLAIVELVRTGPVAPGLFWGSATGCWFAARVRRLPISPGALALVTADAEKGVFGRLDV
jgi:hypothetical protein